MSTKSTNQIRRDLDDAPVPTAMPSASRRRLDSTPREQSRLYNLTLDVNTLHHEIQQLSLHRSLLYTRALYTSRDDDGSAFRSAREYFSVFCRGYRVSDHTPPAFVQAVADEHLTLGVTGLGRDMLLEQWRLYTAYFAIRYYKMHSVRVMATDDESNCCILRGDGTFYGSFTMDALRMVFPAALRDPEIMQRLLGKEMVTPIVFFLYFNDEGRMVRHDGETDLLAAVTRALGDAELAATIVQSANVAEESMVEAKPEGRGDATANTTVSSRPPPEPVEHIARAKRSRFTVIQYDDNGNELEKGNHEHELSDTLGADIRPGYLGNQEEISIVDNVRLPKPEATTHQPDDEFSEGEGGDPRLAIEFYIVGPSTNTMQSSVHEIVFTAGLPPRAPNKPSAARRTTKSKKKDKTKTPANAIVLVPHANSTQRVQSKIYNLTLDVNNLRQQVASLETYRSILYARELVSQYDVDGSILKKVKQYFSVFQRGYFPSDRRPAALLTAIADEDLSLGITGFGRDMLLEQWRRYTEYFGMRRCDVPTARILPGTEDEHWEEDENATITVRAALTFQGSFTPTALALIFPAVLKDPDLTQELLGKDFSADAVFHLHFNKSGMLVRHDVDTDFFAVLANALDDPVRAAEIMLVVGVAEESMLADPDNVDDSDDAPKPFLEPVGRIAQTKRTRFAVVTDDDSDESAEEDSRTHVHAMVIEPDAEPSGAATPSRVDARLSMDFLLS